MFTMRLCIFGSPPHSALCRATSATRCPKGFELAAQSITINSQFGVVIKNIALETR